MYEWLSGLVGTLPTDATIPQMVVYCCATVVTLFLVICVLKFLMIVFKSVFRVHL